MMINDMFRAKSMQAGYPQQPRPQVPPQQPKPAPQQPYPQQPQQPAPKPQPSQYAQYQQQVQQAAAYRQYQQQQQYAQQQAQQRATQQQYPQQAQQMQQPTMTPQPPDAGHHTMLAIAAILVIVFAGLGTYFTMISGSAMDDIATISPETEDITAPQATESKVETLDLTIDKLVFADMIYEDFTYDENPSRTYFTGDSIYVYIEPKGFETLKNKGDDMYGIDIVEDLVVTDPHENQVPYLTVPEVVWLTSSPTPYIAIRNVLTLQEDAEEGLYTVTVTIKDHLSGESTSMSETFELIELPLTI